MVSFSPAQRGWQELRHSFSHPGQLQLAPGGEALLQPEQIAAVSPPWPPLCVLKDTCLWLMGTNPPSPPAALVSGGHPSCPGGGSQISALGPPLASGEQEFGDLSSTQQVPVGGTAQVLPSCTIICSLMKVFTCRTLHLQRQLGILLPLLRVTPKVSWGQGPMQQAVGQQCGQWSWGRGQVSFQGRAVLCQGPSLLWCSPHGSL